MKTIIKLILLTIINGTFGKLILMMPAYLNAPKFLAFMALICFNGLILFKKDGEL